MVLLKQPAGEAGGLLLKRDAAVVSFKYSSPAATEELLLHQLDYTDSVEHAAFMWHRGAQTGDVSRPLSGMHLLVVCEGNHESSKWLI